MLSVTYRRNGAHSDEDLHWSLCSLNGVYGRWWCLLGSFREAHSLLSSCYWCVAFSDLFCSRLDLWTYQENLYLFELAVRHLCLNFKQNEQTKVMELRLSEPTLKSLKHNSQWELGFTGKLVCISHTRHTRIINWSICLSKNTIQSFDWFVWFAPFASEFSWLLCNTSSL